MACGIARVYDEPSVGEANCPVADLLNAHVTTRRAQEFSYVASMRMSLFNFKSDTARPSR